MNRNSLFTLVALGLGLALAADAASAESYQFQGRVVDAQTGKSIGANLAITSVDGQPTGVEGDHPQVHYLGKRRIYVDGTFSLRTKARKIVVEVRRGFETVPHFAQIDLATTETHVFKLRRWTNMLEAGYMSGDSHVHFMTPQTAHLQMRAEDLHVVNILVSDFTDDQHLFTGELSEVSSPAHAIWVGQELRDWDHGHLCLLRLRSLVSPLKPYGGRDQPNLLLAPRTHEVHQQHGSVVWAHFSNLPGTESPLNFMLGFVDAVELLGYDDPTALPGHRRPWESSGMSQAEFPVMCGMDLYYQYLNAGFRVPIAAGTDKMDDQMPVGSNRLYARIQGEPTYDAWLEAMRLGRGFVTNGPILTFNAEGEEPGGRLDLLAPKKIKLHATARSILPFSRLELLVNGQVVHREQNEWNARPNSKGLYSLDAEMVVEVDQSSWVAARVTDDPGGRQRILPRGLTVFAHTNPVYVYLNKKPVRLESSVEYLQKYLQATVHWLKTGAHFESEQEKQQALDLADEAQRRLQSDSR